MIGMKMIEKIRTAKTNEREKVKICGEKDI